MEKLEREEETLTEQLRTYQSQLSSVELATEDPSVDDAADLLALKADLKELISLTEESLLEIKKQLLLSKLDTEQKEEVNKPVEGSAAAGCHGEPEESYPSIQGMKCKAPFEEEVSWRGVSYHNAMILCEEPDDKVRVLFTHPRFESMKPCSYYLEGKCKYSDGSCRFSHGAIVPVDQLQSFTEPQFNCLRSGSRCLAKRPDGLWHDATIRHFGDILTIQFTTSGSEEVEMAVENVLPLSGSSDSESDSHSSSDNDSSDEDVLLHGAEEGLVDNDVRVIESKPSNATALGEWEQYTTGIGSKLLAKMGYVLGKGLGKDNQGRVEPVPIEILPAGKSLDACAAIKEESRLKTEGDKERKKKKRKKKPKMSESQSEQEQSSATNMFDFLNTRLGQATTSGANTGRSRTSVLSGSKSANLNVELFKIQESISNLEKKIKALRSRNRERKDKRVEEHIEKKLQSANNELQLLRKQEKIVSNKMKRKSQETKLSVF